MDTNTQRPKEQKGTISALDAAIEVSNRTGKVSHVAPAKAAFGSVTDLLTMIRVCFRFFCNHLLHVHAGRQDLAVDEMDYVELDGLCRHLRSARPGDEGKEVGGPQSVCA